MQLNTPDPTPDPTRQPLAEERALEGCRLGRPECVLRRAAPKERDAASFAEAVATLTWRESVGIDVIFEWLERMGVPVRERADVVQDVLLRAFTSWPTFAPSRYAMPAKRGRLKQSSGSIKRRVFARWLNTIAKNAVAHYFLAAWRHREDLDPDPLAEDAVDASTPAPDARLVRRATRAELAAALRCVPPVWRRAAIGNIQHWLIARELRLRRSTRSVAAL